MTVHGLLRAGCLLLVAATACSIPAIHRGPALDFSPTQGRPITYRQLSQNDFGADRPPARLLAHASALGAVICASIRVTPDSQFHTERVQRTDGSDAWVAIIDRLRFRAEMERDCSWWNPEVPAHSVARILQHEQMHFGLFEIAARHLNERIFALVTVFRFTADTREEAEQAAIAYVRELEVLAVEELRTRNLQYDEQTSYGSRPHRQRDWSASIEQELLATARYAAVSDDPGPLDELDISVP